MYSDKSIAAAAATVAALDIIIFCVLDVLFPNLADILSSLAACSYHYCTSPCWLEIFIRSHDPILRCGIY